MSVSGFIPPEPDPATTSELFVLGAVLEKPTSLDELSLTGDDFHQPLYGDTFDTMRALYLDGKPVDPSTLGYQRPDRSAFYWELREYSDGAHAVDFHAEQVRANSIRRHMASAAAGILKSAQDVTVSVESMTETARAAVDAAAGVRQAATLDSASVAHRVIADIGKATNAMPTPWPRLNHVIRGLRPGALYVLGGRPRMGKSALALQMALKLEKFGYVGYFSLEMPAEEIMRRAVASGAQVQLTHLDGTFPLTDLDRGSIAAWSTSYPGRILFDERASLTASDIAQQVRTWSRQHELCGIVVDYLQLIDGDPKASALQRVTDASRRLKLLAMQHGVPVLVLSQLNRNPEARPDKRPAMSDLRESGAIEQDADVVMLVHNEREALGEEPYNPALGDEIDLLVPKNRHGQSSVVHLAWHGEFQTAYDGPDGY